MSICHAGVLTTVTPSPRLYSVHLNFSEGNNSAYKGEISEGNNAYKGELLTTH